MLDTVQAIMRPVRGDAVNAMSVDVEDYFQVSALNPVIAREDWDHLPLRLEANMERILQIFGDAGVKSTFFWLGWAAERLPQLVRRIAAEGHEIASHGYEHVRVHQQTPAQFVADVSRTKSILEDISGREVWGYRAASYSIDQRNLWALDELQRAGYRYSSSIYPIRHDHYGMPDAPRFPFRLRPDGITEIPITTVTVGGLRLPCGGGGYFRLLPYRISRRAIQRVCRGERKPAVFYFHPWEIDPSQPRVAGIGFRTRFRHYVNLRQFEDKLKRLSGDFSWATMRTVFAEAI
jgi:polysaccharide deacetylase family protein (PEP-CTERM system associated)